MSHRRQLKEMKKVVGRVMKTAANYDRIGKAEFEEILRKIMQQVQRNTNVDADEIAAVTSNVIEAMPNEYGLLREEDKSMEAMIAYLYGKYLQELGLLE
jgi:BMFP domain-containing protein YqiC